MAAERRQRIARGVARDDVRMDIDHGWHELFLLW
jgi:hypothetical protein